MKYTTTLLLDGKSATVATMKGQTRIPVSAQSRSAAGIAAGDTIEVDVVRDDEPRTVEVPDDLQAALDDDLALRTSFASLSYSNQRRHVLSVTTARTAETRERRIGAVLAELASVRRA